MEKAVVLLAFAGGAAALTFPIDASCTAGELPAEVCRRCPALAP